MTKMIPLMTPIIHARYAVQQREERLDAAKLCFRHQNRSLMAELLPPFRNHVRLHHSKNFNGS